MSSHTLTYFGLAARGFHIRVALRKAGLLTEDKRLSFADWAVFEKSSLPLGQLPALEVDGKTYCQSVPLSAYAAKLAGLYPATPLEQLGALYLAVLSCSPLAYDAFPTAADEVVAIVDELWNKGATRGAAREASWSHLLTQPALHFRRRDAEGRGEAGRICQGHRAQVPQGPVCAPGRQAVLRRQRAWLG